MTLYINGSQQKSKWVKNCSKIFVCLKIRPSIYGVASGFSFPISSLLQLLYSFNCHYLKDMLIKLDDVSFVLFNVLIYMFFEIVYDLTLINLFHFVKMALNN